MVESTILQEFSTWVSQNFIASAIAGGVLWDTLKAYLWLPFKNRFTTYFNSEEEAESFFEKLAKSNSINKKKPYRDVEDIYEEVACKKIPNEFIDELKEFIVSNKDKIEMINQDKGDFSSNNQQAGRDINNVKGSQTIINYGRE